MCLSNKVPSTALLDFRRDATLARRSSTELTSAWFGQKAQRAHIGSSETFDDSFVVALGPHFPPLPPTPVSFPAYSSEHGVVRRRAGPGRPRRRGPQAAVDQALAGQLGGQPGRDCRGHLALLHQAGDGGAGGVAAHGPPLYAAGLPARGAGAVRARHDAGGGADPGRGAEAGTRAPGAARGQLPRRAVRHCRHGGRLARHVQHQHDVVHHRVGARHGVQARQPGQHVQVGQRRHDQLHEAAGAGAGRGQAREAGRGVRGQQLRVPVRAAVPHGHALCGAGAAAAAVADHLQQPGPAGQPGGGGARGARRGGRAAGAGAGLCRGASAQPVRQGAGGVRRGGPGRDQLRGADALLAAPGRGRGGALPAGARRLWRGAARAGRGVVGPRAGRERRDAGADSARRGGRRGAAHGLCADQHGGAAGGVGRVRGRRQRHGAGRRRARRGGARARRAAVEGGRAAGAVGHPERRGLEAVAGLCAGDQRDGRVLAVGR